MKNGEKPAFQCSVGMTTSEIEEMGLTKREYFAGQAMVGIIANAPNGQLSNSKEGVELVIKWTDELLKQLEK
jgi:uncharacterized protein YegJ (DUF2314 family)